VKRFRRRALLAPGPRGGLGSDPEPEPMHAFVVECYWPGMLINAQPVTRRLRYEPVAAPVVRDGAAKARNVRLQSRPRARRRRCSPHPVDEPVAGDDLVTAEQEHGEGRPLLCPAERERFVPDEDLERAQNSKLQVGRCLPATSYSNVAPRASTPDSDARLWLLQGICKDSASTPG
jgi:hypothetical protein